MELMYFLTDTGNKIVTTFSGIAEFMQTHGFYHANGDWYSMFDVLVSVGLPIALVAILAKWVIDIFI